MNRQFITGVGNIRRYLVAAGLLFAVITLRSQPMDSNLTGLAGEPPPPPVNLTNINNDVPSTANTNNYIPPSTNQTAIIDQAELIKKYHDELAAAKQLVITRQFALAESGFINLLAEKVPDDIRKEALFQLSAAASGQDDLPRAQSILTQYLEKWPGDARTPEILLRQGQIFRQMGLNGLALGKFYSVMTAALALKSDQLDFYETLVLEAQMEIAETHYLMGHYSDAAEYYMRLLKRSDTGLNRPLAQFRLVRSLAATTNKVEAVGQAQDFITHYANDPEAPEVRYYLAQSLKAIGQNSEALRQVLIFLQQEKSATKDHPEIWSYWQQRVGNEIANELYNEGDYVESLQIYQSLARLDSSPVWQIPVNYQIGITYERLLQTQKALESYNQILNLEGTLGSNASPNLQTVFDMSRWRTNFLSWQNKVETLNRSMIMPGDTNSPSVSTNPTPPEITAQ